MKKQKFEINENFFNFMYHALNEKLNSSLKKSDYQESEKSLDERVLVFWGDFFEQVLGLDRDEVLNKSYKYLAPFLSDKFDQSDPMCASILYHAELAGICGASEKDFDEIYKPLSI
jgi:hypothetical protein